MCLPQGFCNIPEGHYHLHRKHSLLITQVYDLNFQFQFQHLCSIKTRLCLPWLAWLSCLEQRTINQKVLGSIPGQGTCLGFRFVPWSRPVQEATDWCFSLTWIFLCLSPSFLLSLKSVNMSLGEDFFKNYKVHLNDNGRQF